MDLKWSGLNWIWSDFIYLNFFAESYHIYIYIYEIGNLVCVWSDVRELIIDDLEFILDLFLHVWFHFVEDFKIDFELKQFWVAFACLVLYLFYMFSFTQKISILIMSP